MKDSEGSSAANGASSDGPPRPTEPDRGPDLALLAWLAGFGLLMALLLYDLLVGLIRLVGGMVR